MGRILLVARLALRDLRRRPVEAALLLLAVLAATTTLTLGLVLRDSAAEPYQNTRALTAGPDVVMSARTAGQLAAYGNAAGVTARSGPFPVAATKLATAGQTVDVQVIGRDTAGSPVDRPQRVTGGWVRDGGVVVEAAFATAYGLSAGDRVTLGGREFEVAGVAVTAASAPFPATTCLGEIACLHGTAPAGADLPPGMLHNPGLVWLTRADTEKLGVVSYVLNLRLTDPGLAPAFIGSPDQPRVALWTEIRADATEVAGDSQILLMIGAWLLGLLAVASLSVLVGGRMAEQTRRVGLLKAVGGTPGVIACVLLAEYLLVALVAAVAGLTIGAFTAPLLAGPGAGLLGSAGTPALSLSVIGTVTGVALTVAVLATAVPAWRAARSSTVAALADAARPPRRSGWLIALSARLPVPLLLSLRVAARRPRRALLAVAGIAVTVGGIYVALILDGFLSRPLAAGYTVAQIGALRRVLLLWTVILLVLAGVNAIVITLATVLDNRHTSALARALGATPRDVTAALSGAQILPALLGAVLGIFPGGYLLFEAIMGITGGDGDRAAPPGAGQLIAVVLVTALIVAALTAIPAYFGARRPVTESLRAEAA
ncbi:FtsX-like permease family protein [Actinoplanes sp. NPDC023801]|uniref:ABC transporter permease n=1 Tax=Actinoplanes sp. NPDC023801 TaxID=3154595 RepID=UPI0033EB1B41